jgi:hypothetical protein
MSRVDDVRFIMFSRSHHLLYCLPYVDLVIDDCSLLSPLLVRNVLYCTRLCFRGVITYCSAYLTLIWFLTRVLSFLRYWYVTYCTVPDCVWTILRSVFAYGTAYVDSVLDVYAHSISTCFCVFFVPTSTYGRRGTTRVPSTMRMLSGTLMWYCVRSTACVTVLRSTAHTWIRVAWHLSHLVLILRSHFARSILPTQIRNCVPSTTHLCSLLYVVFVLNIIGISFSTCAILWCIICRLSFSHNLTFTPIRAAHNLIKILPSHSSSACTLKAIPIFGFDLTSSTACNICCRRYCIVLSLALNLGFYRLD